jgi:hypothetical protein
MPNNPSGPIRRAQLIAPFGVGSMVIVPGGTSLVIAGLDHWYKKRDNSEISDVEEFKFEEWRLQELLGVSHFRLPPDYRDSFWVGGEPLNLEITIPAFRFPSWHFCPDCKLLKEWPLYTRGIGGRIKCPECQTKKKTRYMFQVPFVAMCEFGHLQDFPWREWVHRVTNPNCDGDLRLIATGSATLAGQKIKCDKCGKERNLEGITQANTKDGKTTTTLSKTLAPGMEFLCTGYRPWLGPDTKEPCDAHIKGSLRSASNVYFAQIRSSIYLPRLKDTRLQELEILLGNPPLSTLISMLSDLGAESDKISDRIKETQPRLLSPYTKDQINTVLKVILNKKDPSQINENSLQGNNLQEDEQTTFRRYEYESLKKDRNDILLKIKSGELKKYSQVVSKHFSKLMLIDKLQETRVFTGFTRIFPENDLTYGQNRQILWKNSIDNANTSWLPAYKVYGEGLFFEFDEEKLKNWELLDEVKNRAKPLLDRYQQLQMNRQLRDRQIGPRFILIHTFAHLIMNRFTFDCGYGSAALRERLYISSNPGAPMAGVLIYTADGDSEGTMGGLVRMGRSVNLEPIVQRALENAKWCSSDPVCMEMGNTHGQGPDSCNLAACHNCALVPETACEEFNRFLDRGLVVGTFENPSIGYFDI